jgi:DnaJ-class molecular chaperone
MGKDKKDKKDKPAPEPKGPPCTLCGGSGRVAGLKCRWCKGTGREPA